jgi:hypothetical protein
MILQLDNEPLTEELNLLLDCIDVVCPIFLSDAIELAAVVIDGVVPLLQVKELS